MKFPSLRLVHKMLLLLVLPAAIQAVLIVILISLDDKAAHSASLAQKQSKAIKIIDEMLFDFGLTIGALFSHTIGPGVQSDTQAVPTKADVGALPSASAYRSKMNARLLALRKTCTNAEERAAVARASTLVEQQAAAIQALEDTTSGAKSSDSDTSWNPDDGVPSIEVIQKVRSLRESLRNMGRFFESYRKLLDYNYRRQEMYLIEEAEQRLAVRNYIVLVLGIQSVLSLLLIIWFSRTTSKRLNRLVENADALPELKELPNNLEGGDELSHLDDTLHKALSDLKSADSVKNNLLNMVAHDVRSPVATASLILSNLDHAGQGSTPELKNTEVTQLRGLLKTIGALVEDLLTFQKTDSGKMELSFSEFKIDELIKEVVVEMTPSAVSRGIELATASAADKSIIADRVKVGQVLRNYLSNAIKFSPDGSTIEIRQIALEKVLKVSVVDSGSGINEKDIHNLFEQFVQVQGTKSELGFGLGLHICKVIIDLHGGEVGVQSNPNQGSEFWFTLPFDEEP